MGIVIPLGKFIVPLELISSPIRKVSRKFLRRFIPKPDPPTPEMPGKVGHFGMGGIGILGGYAVGYGNGSGSGVPVGLGVAYGVGIATGTISISGATLNILAIDTGTIKVSVFCVCSVFNVWL